LFKKFIRSIRAFWNIFQSEKVQSYDPHKVCSVASDAILKNGLKLRFDTDYEPRLYVQIGNKSIICAEFIFETSKGFISIGDNVHIGDARFICRNNIEVGNDVTMAWGITIYDHNSHSINWNERKKDNEQCYSDYVQYNGNNIVNKDWSNVRDGEIVIHDKVWVGFDVTILKGVSLGEGSVIGAKSVVTKNVPPWTVVGGNPAVILKTIPEEMRK
jgi:acetyltransferase-like isoleucine patch superfamily enzyme